MRKPTLALVLLAVLSCLCAGQPLKIAFITDTHFGRNKQADKDMARCIEDINRQDSIDFVLMGGDLTNFGTDEELAGAKKLLDRLKYKYWIVAGNHDAKWSESGCNTFIRTFGYETFDFEAGGWRFLGCNSGPDMRTGPALVPRSSMNWLKGLRPGKPVIFLNHYPLNRGMANNYEVRRELLRLDCRATLAGHAHINDFRNLAGLPVAVCRSTLRRTGPTGYSIVTIRDGVLRVAERQLSDDGTAETLAPWYERVLTPLTETLHYDAYGLPDGYRGLSYAVNGEYPAVRTRWRILEDGNIGCGFALQDGKTGWYATADGKVVAVSLADGSPVWSRRFPAKIYSTPALSGDLLVFACTDGVIYALNASTGEPKWQVKTGRAIVASPAIYKKAVYIGAADGCFRALRLKDGKLLWKRDGIRGFCDGKPYVDAERVVFGTWGRKVYSLSRKTGAVQWEWELKGTRSYTKSPGACTPVRSGDRIFIASPDRRTYCFDARTGRVLFFADGGRESLALSADGKTVYVKKMDGKAFAFPAQIDLARVNGTLAPDSPSGKWWHPDAPVLPFSETDWYRKSGVGSDVGSSPLEVCGDLLLIPSEKGNLHALDARSGKALWVHKIGLGVTNPVSVWTESEKICILASTMDGYVELIEYKPGVL